MRVSDIFSLSTRMFRTRPMRTFLTILGVSVGIGAVLFLVSLGYGLQKVVLNKITTTDSLLSLDVTSGVEDLLKITQTNIDDISKIDNVELVSPIVSLTSQVSVNGFTGSNTAHIVNYDFFKLGGVSVDYGEMPSADDPYAIIISSVTAELFGLEPENILNKETYLSLFVPKTYEDSEVEEVILSERKEAYHIVGVIDDVSANYMFVSAVSVRDLNLDTFDQLKVRVTDSEHIEDIRNQIIDKGFLVSSLSDVIDQTNKIFEVIQLILAIFGLIALIVSAIGMINTMTIALLERINEIGIMRAIGITKKDIRIIFLTESLIMGFLGGVGGLAVGFAGSYIVNLGINLLANTFGGQSLDLFYCPVWFAYFIIIFSTLIGLLTGIYPSIKASKLNPLTALRYK